MFLLGLVGAAALVVGSLLPLYRTGTTTLLSSADGRPSDGVALIAVGAVILLLSIVVNLPAVAGSVGRYVAGILCATAAAVGLSVATFDYNNARALAPSSVGIAPVIAIVGGVLGVLAGVNACFARTRSG